LRKNRHDKKVTFQKGFTLIESVIAMGIIGIVMFGGIYEIRKANQIEDIYREAMALDSIESFLMDVLSARDGIVTSARRSGRTRLYRCLSRASSPCRSGRGEKVSFFPTAKGPPVTGGKIYYSKDGRPCGKPGCGPYRVSTTIVPYCARGYASCAYPAQVQVRFEIRRGGKAIRSGRIERVRSPLDVKDLSAACPNEFVLRGIGMNGEPLCINSKKVKYVDADGAPKTSVVVKSKDCRSLGGGDEYFVSQIDKSGDLVCTKKFW
jgi:prepilin-type N-terminal cleavage/methylation domain-containing protein